MRSVFVLAVLVVSFAEGTPSPAPRDLLAASAELSIPTPAGAVRGGYEALQLGNLLFDSGTGPAEETIPGEARRWVFQGTGRLIVGGHPYSVTCIRASRFNVLSPRQDFYYELRISALEGSCTEKADKRLVELVLTMDDFVVKRFRSAALRYFGQTSELQLFSTLLRVPERIDAVAVDGGYQIGGRFAELPFVSNLALEIMLRPRGETSCLKAKFNPERDPYSSQLALPDSKGKWGAIVPKTGGGVCLRLVGGGWTSPVSSVKLP